MNMNMNVEAIETMQEMVEYLEFHYGEKITCADVRGHCEILFSRTGIEMDPDEVMIKLGKS